LYKTQVERDWAYIAKREYNYDVRLKALSYSFACGNLAWSASMFIRKRFLIWPLPFFWIAAYPFFSAKYQLKHQKKHFDMCNVGEEYYLGAQRNFVLRKCNEILDREDF
jgi:hypothetical protein